MMSLKATTENRGDCWVACAENFKIFTYGETESQARWRLHKAVSLMFEQLLSNGGWEQLEYHLTKCGVPFEPGDYKWTFEYNE